MRRRLALLITTFLLSLIADGCRHATPAGSDASSLTRAAVEALEETARLDLAGLAQDTLRWRLKLELTGFSSRDSAYLANSVAKQYGKILEPSASRELYVQGGPFTIRGDEAVMEARVGARWPCARAWTGSFAAYRYRFVHSRGTWRLDERLPSGHGDAAGGCRP